MVKGLDVFKDFFRDFQNQYVLIGGAACDIVFQEADLAFRATKDLDMVLIIEALTPEFGKRFWDFIKMALASRAFCALIPLQDYLGLGSSARFNAPGVPSGNWRWRYRKNDLTEELAHSMKYLSQL